MMILQDTDSVRVITSAAVTVDVVAAWADKNGTTITPGRTLTAITTATTTPVVAAPSSGLYRNVQSLLIKNKHATASVVVTVEVYNGSTAFMLEQATLQAGGCLQYFDGVGFVQKPGADETPDWHGTLYAAYGRCDPQQLLRMATMGGSVAATPTNISTTVARCAFFRPPANITVATIRFFGVGNTTNIYTAAIYRHSDLARLTGALNFSTTAATWGTAATGLSLSLTKDTLYIMAVGANTTGTTAGILCMSPTQAATTGTIGVLPHSWPGSLALSGNAMDGAFLQFAVTAGAMPHPAATLALQAAWTGGMPLFFLDSV